MSSWVKVPIKRIATLNDDTLADDTASDFRIHYVEISDVSEGTIAWGESMAFGHAPSRARRKIRNGDVLVSTVRTYLRAVSGVDHAPTSAVASTGFAVLRPRGVERRFLKYALLNQDVLDDVVSQSVGISYPAINASDLVRIKIAVPDEATQACVSDYLDRETAEIDAFVADQEELIGLLAERRAATISHAVTKGLDPSIPIVDTGASWFPSLPAHWALISIKRGARLIQTGPFGSQVHSSDYVRDGVPLINPVHMTHGKITSSKDVTVTSEKAAELRRHSLLESDIVVARRGELGRCAVVSTEDVGSLCGTGSALIRLRPERFVADYFQLVFSAAQTRAALLQYSAGSTMDNLNAEVVGAIRIPCPPRHEQIDIVRELEQRTSELDAAIADAREAIALSRERRAALISAAVTGKIDVRGAA